MQSAMIRHGAAAVSLVASLVMAQPLAARPGSHHGTALKMQGDWAVVEVRLGGERDPYRFIVDSAAGATVIDQALASRFTSNFSGSSNVQGADRRRSDRFEAARVLQRSSERPVRLRRVRS